MPPSERESSSVQSFPPPLAALLSSSPYWFATIGGTAVVAAATAAWMSYTSTNKRFVPLSFIRRNFLTTTSSSTKSKSYYLDFNGTTPIYPEVFDAMIPYLKEHFGNPSSSHLFGREPREAIKNARKLILTRLLGVRASGDCKGASSLLDLSSIWFTGCGTESDNMAIRLALLSSPSSGGTKNDISIGQSNSISPRRSKHVVTCNVEHPAIENYLRHLETENDVTVTRVEVDTEGRVSAKDVVAAITPDTVLVTLMLANNESGALQPVKEVAEECRRRGILFHTDAAVRNFRITIVSEYGVRTKILTFLLFLHTNSSFLAASSKYFNSYKYWDYSKLCPSIIPGCLLCNYGCHFSIFFFIFEGR